MSIESNRPAITHARRPNADDRASQNATTDIVATALRFHMQLHMASRQQPVTRLEEHPAGGDVDQFGLMPRSDTGRYDSVRLDVVVPWRAPTLGSGVTHSGLHFLARRSNFSTRVLPVVP